MEEHKGTIDLMSKSDKNNSFHLKDEDMGVWYKLADQNIEDIIQKGSQVKFNFEVAGASRIVNSEDIEVLGQEESKQKSNSNEDMQNLDGLLKQMHDNSDGNFSIRSELVEHDKENQSAFFRAEVVVGENIFSAHGDATQQNTGDNIKIHYFRMAETRAICRALRWATNNSEATKEEKGE